MTFGFIAAQVMAGTGVYRAEPAATMAS